MATKTKTSKKGRAVSASPTHKPSKYQVEYVEKLEAQLKAKDATIAELTEKVNEQETILEHRLRCMERLRRERDELRNKTSSLIGKNAELARKQNVGKFGAPSRQGSRSLCSSLPPTPDSPPANSSPPTQNQSKGSPEIRVNGRVDTSFNIDEESETDYSDMEDNDEKQAIFTNSSREDQFVNSGMVAESDIMLELDTVLKTVSGSSLTIGNGNSSSPDMLFLSNNPAGKMHPEKLPDAQVVSSTKITAEMSSFNSQTDSSKVQNGGPVPPSQPKKVSGSGAVAQHIKHFLTKRNSRSNNGTVLARGAMSTRSKTEPKSGSLIANDQTSQRVGQSGTWDNQSTNISPDTIDSITSTATTASFCPSENDVFSSFDYTTTDQDSSFDFASPPVSPLKTSSVQSRLIPPTSELSKSLNILPVSKRKMKVKFSDDSEDRDIFDSTPTDSGYTMRSRTNTLAAINSYSGQKPLERGRKKLRELRKDGSGIKLRRQNSLTDLTRAHKDFNLDLLSPELQSWYRAKVIRALENKYGGTVKANRAAMVIQREYREFTLNRIFKEIREGKNRMRAQSMRDRRPSILQKNKPTNYRREYKTSGSYNPQLKAREASQLLSRERSSHSHSGSRLDLVHKKRRQEQDIISEKIEVTLEAPLKSGVLSTSPGDTFTVEGVCDTESSTDPATTDPSPSTTIDKPDGLSRPLSSEDTQSQQRLSIFSTGSTVSSSISFQEELQEHDDSNTETPTLPGAAPSQGRSRILSIDTANQKKNIGVNHFNRKPIKGIQYLVMSDILEDDPRCVAEFLVNQYGLSKQKIGEFLGEINSDFSMAVLECLVELMDMSSKPIDEALRLFQKIFRMPGEAQKIDKIMEVFAVEYYKSNKGVGSIRSEDAAYMLSFAIMMLHTSLHNPSVRSRITRKQWVTMNRGCNEGENFPENLLLETYDRLQLNQFTTGQDHTDEVLKIEKQIIGSTVPKLANPQRHFLQKLSVSEVMDLNSRPSFGRNKHKRVLFLFSDIIIVCKQRRNEHQFKESFSLLNLTAIRFESHYYKHGLQLHSSLEDRVVLQCNCDSSQDRNEILGNLEIATAELTMMDTERIVELGTSLALKPKQDLSGGSVKHRLTTGAGDLLSSTQLKFDDPRDEQSDYVSGVGDLAISTNTSYQGLLRDDPPTTTRENRSSADSGFDSQRPTPTLSPSPTERASFQTPSPSLSPLHATYLTPNPTLTTPPRSKSSDTLRTLTVVPTTTKQKPPNSESSLRRDSNGSDPNKKSRKKKKYNRGGLFSFSRNKTASVSVPIRPGSYSPPMNKDTSLQDSGLLSVQVRMRSSSATDLTRTT